MQVTLPLDKMNISEKLRALEDIWDDLCHSQDGVPSPEWHRDVLQAREHRIQEGTATFIALDDAKRRIWDQL